MKRKKAPSLFEVCNLELHASGKTYTRDHLDVITTIEHDSTLSITNYRDASGQKHLCLIDSAGVTTTLDFVGGTTLTPTLTPPHPHPHPNSHPNTHPNSHPNSHHHR